MPKCSFRINTAQGDFHPHYVRCQRNEGHRPGHTFQAKDGTIYCVADAFSQTHVYRRTLPKHPHVTSYTVRRVRLSRDGYELPGGSRYYGAGGLVFRAVDRETGDHVLECRAQDREQAIRRFDAAFAIAAQCGHTSEPGHISERYWISED